MKLKKIVSLALAGILAVSMLTACGDNSSNNGGASSSEPTVSSNFTTTVMGKASKAVNSMLEVSTDDTLDKAVAVAAENGSFNGNYSTLNRLGSTEDIHQKATKAINDSDWTDPATDVEVWAFTDNTNNSDKTFYNLYVVTAPKTTDWIAGEIADKLDTMVKSSNGDKNCEYSIRVAYAEMDGSDNDTKNGYLVGVAITVDNTENNH